MWITSSKKNLTKKEICPICNTKVRKPNEFVKYHLRYSPELTIMACKYCNFTEYALRNNKPLPPCGYAVKYKAYDQLTRASKIIRFHNKLGLKL